MGVYESVERFVTVPPPQGRASKKFSRFNHHVKKREKCVVTFLLLSQVHICSICPNPLFLSFPLHFFTPLLSLTHARGPPPCLGPRTEKASRRPLLG